MELESREEIIYEIYAKTINIEALTMIDMAGKRYIPAVVKYSRLVAQAAVAVREAGLEPEAQADLLREVNGNLSAARRALEGLKEAAAQAVAIKNAREQAFFYKDVVMKAMEELRTPIDALEMMVDKEIWPVPSYGELAFEI